MSGTHLTRVGENSGERSGLEINPQCPRLREGRCRAQEKMAPPREREQTKGRGLSTTKPSGLVKEEKTTQTPRGSGQSVKSHGCQGREWAPVVNTDTSQRRRGWKDLGILEVLVISAESVVTARRGIQVEGSEESRKEDKPGDSFENFAVSRRQEVT